MQMNSIIQINTGEYGKNVGLKHGNEDFKAGQRYEKC
jgi:hypothetical protein